MEKLDKAKLEEFKNAIERNSSDHRTPAQLAQYVSKFIYRVESIITVLWLAGIGPQYVSLQGSGQTIWSNITSYTRSYGNTNALINGIIEYAESSNLAGWLPDTTENSYTDAEWAAIQRWVNR